MLSLAGVGVNDSCLIVVAGMFQAMGTAG